MKWLKMLGFASYLLGWLSRASADGVITKEEIAELVQEALEQFHLEIPVRIE